LIKFKVPVYGGSLKTSNDAYSCNWNFIIFVYDFLLSGCERTTKWFI